MFCVQFLRKSTVIHHDMDIHACSFVSSPRGSTRQHTRCSCRRALDPRYDCAGERLMRAVPAGRAKQRGRFVRLLATGRRGFKILHAAHFVRKRIRHRARRLMPRPPNDRRRRHCRWQRRPPEGPCPPFGARPCVLEQLPDAKDEHECRDYYRADLVEPPVAVDAPPADAPHGPPRIGWAVAYARCASRP